MTAVADSATPNPVTLLEQTTARTKMVMAGVRQSQIDAPTPCAEWNVHGLVNHLIGGLEFTAACIAGIPTTIRPSEAESSQINERAVGNLAQAYDAALSHLLELAAAPGALERTAMTPFGEMPVNRIFVGTVMDQLIHCWDLAKATGQDTTLDADLVDFAFPMLQSGFADLGRQAGFIGPEQAIADDASQLDKLIAYMGRKP